LPREFGREGRALSEMGRELDIWPREKEARPRGKDLAKGREMW